MSEGGRIADSDEALLRQFAAGDRAAFAALAERYEQALLGLARGLLNGRHDLALDAVQETWVRVIRFASSFNGRSSAKTWLYRIAINQCRVLRITHEKRGSASPIDEQTLVAGQQPAVDNSSQRRLQAAVACLPPDHRAMLLLCYHQQVTHEQAAEILEIPLGTLKSRLHATLQELRTVLSRDDLK